MTSSNDDSDDDEAKGAVSGLVYTRLAVHRGSDIPGVTAVALVK